MALNERPAGGNTLRHKFIGAMPSSLSLRGGRRPTWQSRSTRPNCGKAIGENATAFRDCTPRALPPRFALRAPRPLRGLAMTRPEAFRILHFSVFRIHSFPCRSPAHTRLTALQNFPLSIFDFPRSPILFFSVFLYKYFRIESAKIRKKINKVRKYP